MQDRCSLSVIILTFNEEIHIERCISSVMPIASKIFVVDSYSTDRTVEIAKSLGAEVYQHPFVNQAQQLQWALDTLPIETEWIMRLDADEYLEEELVQEIQQRLSTLPKEVCGVLLKRRQIFMGRWIKHGSRYPLKLLRIWRTGMGRVEQRWMDEHVVVQEGKVISFAHDFNDHNLRDLHWWTDKHNKYATREAIEVLGRRYGLFDTDAASANLGLTQAGVKRKIKEYVYDALPAFIGPVLYFCYRYFICLGFLDGKEGFVYHFLQGLWYRFLVEAKVMEFDQELKKLDDNQSRLAMLEQLTGYPLQ